MKLLYVGSSIKGCTSLQRYHSLKMLFDSSSFITNDQSSNFILRIFSKLLRSLFNFWFDYSGINKKILAQYFLFSPDVVWIDKTLLISKDTLLCMKNSIIVFYCPDDLKNPGNTSRQLNNTMVFYDYFITTKSYNVEEFKNKFNKVIFVNNAFDPSTHKRLPNVKKIYDVAFIGSYEKERFESILFLCRKGIKVTVIGSSWKKHTGLHENLCVIPHNFMGEDYALKINQTLINLSFLRKVNRDLQTTRSIEIPACGGFMISEISDELKDLFQEDSEVVFFKSNEELYDKVIFYMNNKYIIEKISFNGFKRCYDSDYSNLNTLSTIFDEFKNKNK